MNGLVIQSGDGGENGKSTNGQTDTQTNGHKRHGRQMGLPVPVNNRNTFSPPSEIMI